MGRLSIIVTHAASPISRPRKHGIERVDGQLFDELPNSFAQPSFFGSNPAVEKLDCRFTTRPPRFKIRGNAA